MIKRFLTILFLCVLVFPVGATNYYVKNGGSDSANGLSDATAWANHPWMEGWTTSAKSLSPGDTVFLKAGSVWTDKITVAQSGASGSPIVISSYGTGSQPLISGFVTLTGWTLYSGSVYYTTLVAEAQTNMVTVDGVNTGMGRWPDTGYRIFESYNNTGYTITDNELLEETPHDWDGAEVVIRKNNWSLDRCAISSHSGDVITYSLLGGDGGVIGNNYGYFIQNDLRTVTATNEWYHSHSTNTLYIYGNPSGKTVRAATKTKLIYNNGFDYVSIHDIALEGSISNLIESTGTVTSFSVMDCTLSFSGENAIMYINTPSYCIVTGNTISDSQAAGIKLWGGTENTISYNNVNNSGMILGMGYIAFRHCGIYTSGTSNLDILHNRVINSASNAIIIDGTYNLVQYNYVENASLRVNDSGGIYAGSSAANNSTLDHNIIYNVPGDGSGTPYASNPLARGLYVDDFAQYLTITNNIIHTSTESAMMLHDANDNTVRNNILYNSKYGLYYLSSSAGSIRRNLVDHNQFVALTATQYSTFAQAYSGSPGDISNFGTINYNIYARPINQSTDQTHLRTWDATYTSRTLSGWQTFTGHDANSTYNLGGVISSTNDIRLIFNETVNNKSFTLSAAMKGLDNASYSGTVTLSPFTGLVLLGVGTVTEVEDPEPDPDPPSSGSSGNMLFNGGSVIMHDGKTVELR